MILINALGSKDAANPIAHMAQWESAPLEADNAVMAPPTTWPQCLDELKAWAGVVTGVFTFNTGNLHGLINDNLVVNLSVSRDGCSGRLLDTTMGLHEMAACFHQYPYKEENNYSN
ncbi:hypothetical protein V6N13_105286 [Hibiscus sabdariffa]|uniref:Uncharacterized protein n=1 Tax=Hibiscus sabdariffa TaxID=183260 RepID=A0ABR2EXN7_9ROSI